VAVSGWLWWLAAVLAVLAVVFALTRLDAMRAELDRAARDSDPSAAPDVIDQVVDLSVLVIVGGGLVLGLVGALLALGLRAGRGWTRVTLVVVALLAVAYGVLVVSATGWLVLAYSGVAVAAAVCMYLPGARRWFA
jgi:hypothetical protein